MPTTIEPYAAWAGKGLPTEAEWEFAARGGLEGTAFTWGDEHFPKGKAMANTWRGKFPWENQLLDGYPRTWPVEKFPPNGYGLYDMAGNVWEWTSDSSHRNTAKSSMRAVLRGTPGSMRSIPARPESRSLDT